MLYTLHSKFGVASKSVRGLLKFAVETLKCYNDVNMLPPLWSVGFFTINPLKKKYFYFLVQNVSFV